MPSFDKLIRWAERIRSRFDAISRRVDPFGVVIILAAFTAATIALMGAVEPARCHVLPVRIIDLELTFSARRFAGLLEALSVRQCEHVFLTSLITTDLLFPIAYGLALCALFIWAERQRRFNPKNEPRDDERVPKRNHVLLILPLAAAAVDIVLENIPLWIAGTLITADPQWAKSTIAFVLVLIGSLGAALKWSLVFVSILAVLAELMHAPRGIVIKRLRYAVLAVLLGALPLLLIPQGQDILQRTIEGNSAIPGIVRALVALTFGAVVVWYCGRKLVQLRFPRDPSSSRDWYDYFADQIPRILGITVLFLGAAAFARAAAATPSFAAFAIGGFVAAWAIDRFWPPVTRTIGRVVVRGYLRLVDNLDRDAGRAFIALIIGLGILIAPGDTHDFVLLRRAAYLLLLIAWLFYLYIYSRRGRIAARESVKNLLPAAEEQLERVDDAQQVDLTKDVYQYELVHVEAASVSSIDPKLLDRAIRRTLIVGGLVSIAALAAFTFWPVPFARWLGALMVLSMAVANVVFIGSIATWVHERHGIPLAPIAIAFAVLFSVWNDSHFVRRLTGNSASVLARRDIPTHLAMRNADSVNGPIVLVAAAGGGLRAAYWTATSLATLEDRIPGFHRNVFAISSVSGGSLGASVYASLVRDSAASAGQLKCLATRSPGTFAGCVREFMSEDYLSPVLAKIVAPDFVQSFLPFPWRQLDRSLALEGSWEDSYEKVTGLPTMRNGFLALYRNQVSPTAVPALFLNTTHVETGKRYITAPLTRGDSTPPIDGRPQTMHDSQDLLELMGSDIPLSTAAHNSARFSFVSPPGRIHRGDTIEYGHVVDGGYFENSGLATLREILEAVQSSGGTTPPVVLYLCNDPLSCREKPKRDSLPTAPRSALADWLGPIRALMSTREARGSLSRAAIIDLPNVEFIQLNVCDALIAADTLDAGLTTASTQRQKRGRERVISPPLGWQLSKVARDWMDSSLTPGADSLRPSRCRRNNAAALERLQAMLRQ
jgi:hypothetical protein